MLLKKNTWNFSYKENIRPSEFNQGNNSNSTKFILDNNNNRNFLSLYVFIIIRKYWETAVLLIIYENI